MRTLGLLLLLSAVAGCGMSKGKVSGRVLYQGTPLPGGMVTFQPADSKLNAIAAMVDEQGNYEATLPAGEVHVAVDNRALQPRSPGLSGLVPPGLSPEARNAMSKAPSPPWSPAAVNNAPTQLRGKYVDIPAKYYSIEESGLQFTVESGNQKHDIELK